MKILARLVGFEPATHPLLRQGAAWGARREVIKLAESVMVEFMESLVGLKLADGPIEVDVI